MKRIIGIIGVTVFAVTLSYNISIVSDNNSANVHLSNLLEITSANAECSWGGKGPKLVEDCVKQDGTPGSRYICDKHNDDCCKVTACS